MKARAFMHVTPARKRMLPHIMFDATDILYKKFMEQYLNIQLQSSALKGLSAPASILFCCVLKDLSVVCN